MRGRAWLVALIALLAAPAVAETLTLTGVLTGADHQTYREVPFQVPAGTTSVTVAFAYDGKDQKAVVDLGLRDPQRFRGWSGGNKAAFTLTETWATSSYLPGPLPAGRWRLIMGVPNLRKGTQAHYTATITLEHDGVFHGFPGAPANTGPGWYRGDLHLHTGHSDGSCAAQSGARVPCPVFRTLEAAVVRGLDFVAVTDHNTSSHFQALAELQPAYDRLLLIPGREVTTFQGHANIIGMTAPLDFQLGGPRAPTFARILDQAERAGALVSINHPGLPSGEACLGCGWTAMRKPLVISLGIGIFWLAAANASPILATVMIAVMAATAIAAFLLAGEGDPWLQVRPVALYAGWLTAAAGVGSGVLLGGYGILSNQLAAIVCLVLVLAVALIVQAARPREWGYPVAIIWALVGVIVANASGPDWGIIALGLMGVAVLALRAVQGARKGAIQ